MDRRVVITGYGVINDLGKNKEEVREKLFAGKSGLSKYGMEAVDGVLESTFGRINDLTECSDFFEKNNVPYDRCTQLAMMAASECVSQANVTIDDPYRYGISIGTSLGGTLSGEKFHEQWINDGLEAADKELLKQYPLHAMADALSLEYGFRGCKNIISTACAASGNSIGYGFDMIKNGTHTCVLAGGVDPLSRFSFSGFVVLKAIDYEACRPYSASTGINLGEGGAFFMLEDYEHAVNRGANIIAELYACGLSADAYHQTAPAKGGVGAIRSMKAAINQAGIEPENISYVNGHGTGTKANDTNETAAFKDVFGDTNIPLSSTKGATGHCLGAAGAVEFAVSIMAIENDVIPPTIRFEGEGTSADVDYVPNSSREHECNMVLSNSFAFGGNNCSLIVGKPGLYAPKHIEEKEIVITGIGCIGNGGNSIQELFDTFDTRKRTDFDIKGYDLAPYKSKYGIEIPDIEWKKHIPIAFVRKVDAITKLTMASGKQAMTDAKLTISRQNMEKVGVIYATGTGPMQTIEAVDRSVVEKGIHAVDPSKFPSTVLNAAPGNLSIANQLKGPISAICVGGVSGLIGFDYACEILKNGQAEAIVAVTSDESNEPIHMGYDKFGMLSTNGLPAGAEGADGFIHAPGSVAFILETKESALARGAKIYATVKGYAICSDDSEIATVKGDGKALSKAIEIAKERAGIDNPDLYVCSATGYPEFDENEAKVLAGVIKDDTFVSAPAALLGYSFGTSGSYGILDALYSFETGKVVDMPEGDYNVKKELDKYLIKSENRQAEIKTACISSTGYGGTYAALVLEKY